MPAGSVGGEREQRAGQAPPADVTPDGQLVDVPIRRIGDLEADRDTDHLVTDERDRRDLGVEAGPLNGRPGPLVVLVPARLPLVESILHDLVHGPLVTWRERTQGDALRHRQLPRIDRPLEEPVGREYFVPARAEQIGTGLVRVVDGLREPLATVLAGPRLGPVEQPRAEAVTGVRRMHVDL
jgi:hypothetical protein